MELPANQVTLSVKVTFNPTILGKRQLKKTLSNLLSQAPVPTDKKTSLSVSKYHVELQTKDKKMFLKTSRTKQIVFNL